jgi:hypothetical protein
MPARARARQAEAATAAAAAAPPVGVPGEGREGRAAVSNGGSSCRAMGAGAREGVRPFRFLILICGVGEIGRGLDEDEGRIFVGGRRGALRVPVRNRAE